MRQSHALAYLRQICCSGLSWEIAITEFLQAIPKLIQSSNNNVTVCSGELHYAYMLAGFDLSEMAATAPSIVTEYLTLERRQRAAAWFMQNPLISDPRIMEEAFYQTDMYKLIYTRFDLHHLLWASVPLDGNFTGVLGLFRPRSQKPFDDRDQMQVVHLLPYLVHAYRAAVDVNFDHSPSGDSGMLVMDVQGAILYQCPEAKRLLQLASYPRLVIESRRQNRLQLKLAELCRNLQNIYRGSEASPPSFTHTGPNGQFLFRGYWLDRSKDAAGGLIGVIVEHRQPLMLNILRGMRDSPLSPTQKQVTQLLAQGFTQEQIGKHLHVKPTTVKDHIGKIYLKLDIHQREELLPKLLTLSHKAHGRQRGSDITLY